MRSQMAAESDSNNPMRQKEYELRRQLRLVELEKQAFIKDLLNYEIPLEPLRGWRSRTYERYDSALQTVPLEKRERVRRIQENYWYQSDLLREKYYPQRPPAYLEEYKRINEERSAQLGALLSPTEFENYEMRSSSFPSRLASELKYFKPTEDELRAIYKTMKEVEQPYGGGLTASNADDFDPAKHGEKKDQAEEALKSVLGEERHQQYLRTKDEMFQNLGRLGDSYAIPEDKINAAYEVAAKTRILMAGLLPGGGRRSPDDPPDVEGLRKDAETQLKELLGNRAAKKFINSASHLQPPVTLPTDPALRARYGIN
jgi:hypothetical protein